MRNTKTFLMGYLGPYGVQSVTVYKEGRDGESFVGARNKSSLGVFEALTRNRRNSIAET